MLSQVHNNAPSATGHIKQTKKPTDDRGREGALGGMDEALSQVFVT
jgi:hypothetical protein